MKVILLTTVVLGFIDAIKPPNANFLQLEPTDLQVTSKSNVALSERDAHQSLSETEVFADNYGWSALLIPSNFTMAICGAILFMFVIPMIWLNEWKNARIYYVLTRAM